MLTRDQKNQNSLNLFLNTYFNIIIVFVLFLFLTAAYVVAIKPKYQETMLSIQANIEQQSLLLMQLQKNLASLKVVSELYSKISTSDLEKFNGVLPNNYIKERLFGEIDEMISQSGFIVDSITIEDDSLPSKVKESEEATGDNNEKVGDINLRLSVSAINYPGLKRTLRLIENNLRLFDIEEVVFSAGENSVDFVLATYYYKK